MQANWARHERQRSSIYTTAETILEAYADPASSSTHTSRISPPTGCFDSGTGTLYLCASAREQRRLRPVSIALLEDILEAT